MNRGDSRIGEILIQPAGWAEASGHAESLLAGFARSRDRRGGERRDELPGGCAPLRDQRVGGDQMDRALSARRLASAGRTWRPSAFQAHAAPGFSRGGAGGEGRYHASGALRPSFVRPRGQGRHLDDEPVLPPDRRHAQKKTLVACERDRPAISRHRARWRTYQGRIDPSRLIFIDETLGSSPRAGSGPKPT